MIESTETKRVILSILICTVPVYLFYVHQVNALCTRWKKHKRSEKTKSRRLETLSEEEIRVFIRKNRVSKVLFTSMYVGAAVMFVIKYFGQTSIENVARRTNATTIGYVSLVNLKIHTHTQRNYTTVAESRF